MNESLPVWLFVISLLVFISVFVFINFGYKALLVFIQRQEAWYDHTLNHKLLLGVDPRTCFYMSVIAVISVASMFYLVLELPGLFIGAFIGFILPIIFIKHAEAQRARKLDEQIVDGVTTLSSGVRAGLNLVQSMENLVTNSVGPIRQEFSQLLAEYQMGIDLNQAMRNTSNRIGSSNYRLLFTAIEMHRLRGGDAAESLDRIAESIREIQRLEGKLDALTAQGRTQANMMAAMPVVILVIMYFIDSEGVSMLFTNPGGRMILFVSAVMIFIAFIWIKKIMAIDI
jgi:tight adherence protein B